MKATTPFLFFLSAGVQSLIGVEAYDGDQYEYQYQNPSYRDYTGKPEASSEGGLPWFYYRGDGPPEMCKYSNLTPSQYYSLMCPNLHGQVQEIVPGYKVRFFCGSYGSHNGIQLSSSTPEQCAQLCEADPGCTGSSWLSDRKLCTLSGPLAAGSRGNTIYMQKIIETPEPEDPFAENCSNEFQRESADKFAECSRQQRDCVDQLGQCRSQIIQGEQQFSNQLNKCSIEKNQINNQLTQCNAERQSAEQCEQRIAEKDRQFSEQLISCEARNGKDKQQADLELSHQKAQYLQRVQELEAQLGNSRAQLLSCQLDSAKQLAECNRRSSIEKQVSDAQLATCRRDLEDAKISPRERESALMRCPTHNGVKGMINGREYRYECQKTLTGTSQLVTARRRASTIHECVRQCLEFPTCNWVAHDGANCDLYSKAKDGTWDSGRPVYGAHTWDSALLL